MSLSLGISSECIYYQNISSTLRILAYACQVSSNMSVKRYTQNNIARKIDQSLLSP